MKEKRLLHEKAKEKETRWSIEKNLNRVENKIKSSGVKLKYGPGKYCKYKAK